MNHVNHLVQGFRMSTELLTSKLFVPPRCLSLVSRARLIQLLNEGLSLDNGDNNLACFLAYLTTAFQQADEQNGARLLSALQSPQHSDKIVSQWKTRGSTGACHLHQPLEQR
jgi:ATP/maltotriose-dependent transcriptional regulator MalT